jgi:hypothetical protein
MNIGSEKDYSGLLSAHSKNKIVNRAGSPGLKINLDLSVIKKAGENFENRRGSDIFLKYGDCSLDNYSEIGLNDGLEWPSFLS